MQGGSRRTAHQELPRLPQDVSYGFKMQLLINSLGVPHSVALASASMHDSRYLAHIKDLNIADCEVVADMGYLSEWHQLSLFENLRIQLTTPSRSNMKRVNTAWTPQKRYLRKRIEILNSQLEDQMMIKRNYAKSLDGLFTRVVTKVVAAAVLQMINFKNNKPLNHIKHALAA